MYRIVIFYNILIYFKVNIFISELKYVNNLKKGLNFILINSNIPTKVCLINSVHKCQKFKYEKYFGPITTEKLKINVINSNWYYNISEK